MSVESDAVDVVTRFLRLLEDRRLPEASELLAPDVEITFPGGRRFHDLEKQVASSAGRFRGVQKVFEGIDAMPADGGAVVYVHGTLAGEDLAGVGFSGVRFIDRFEVLDGKIVDQRVWNDLAETGVVRPERIESP